MKALVTYDTKYGNTKKVAELIAKGLESAGESEVEINHVSDVGLNQEKTYDLIVIGSPNHMGSHTEKVRKFIKNLSKSPVKGKSFAVFDTYQSKDFEKAVKKLEKQITKKIPDMERALAGLSIKVTGLKGPILEEDLPKCEDFGKELTK
ncbi:MAG: flavodoxin family protein [Candidatus Thorarchaeota archaeon]